MKVKVEMPENWREMMENIRKVRQKFPAPVDTMGCAQVRDNKNINQRFQVLVSLMLSSQTKDPITWAAVQRLKERNICTVNEMVQAKEKDIEDLIYPVGFYRRKAVSLKKVAQILQLEYDCDIPKTIEDLCKLPGVGPKMAHLCMLEAWNEVTGIGVDVHVHRIAARLGWVPSQGIKTPEDTRKALESWLPREYWSTINRMLVGFGQTICTPLRPKCSECYNNAICPSSNLKSTTTTSSSSSKQSSPDKVIKVKKEVTTKTRAKAATKMKEEVVKTETKAPRVKKEAVKSEFLMPKIKQEW